MYEDNIESEVIEAHVSCDKCGSSDARSNYSDGHGYCYSCGHYYHPEGKPYTGGTKRMPVDFTPVEGTVKPLKVRGITKETCQKFGYKIGKYNGEPAHIANYHKDGNLVGQKIRLANKEFRWNGIKERPLFGMHLWKSGGKMIVVTEGEIDCLTVSQVQDNRWPVVSIPQGAQGAKRAISDNIEYLEGFESVVLMFDQDEPGQKAAKECAQLLSPGKAKIASLPLKDPNEMLLAGKEDAIRSCIWNASDYAPDAIVNMEDLWEGINQKVERGLSYPWPTLTEITDGVRLHEMILLGAGTGLGKTTFFRQIIHHFVMEHKLDVGIVFSEETVEETARELVALELEVPLSREDADMEKKREAFEKFGSKVHMIKNFLTVGFDGIVSRIRYLHLSKGVQYFFVDHVTAMVSGGDFDNERIALDNIMTKLRDLTTELNITIMMISHLTTPEKGAHEEGANVSIRQFRGSRALGQWPNTILAIERNQQDEDESKRHTSIVKVLKHRPRGSVVGRKIPLKFNERTAKLTELKFDEEPKSAGTPDTWEEISDDDFDAF